MSTQLREQLDKARKLIQDATRPIFLFDDDPDGLAAFLLLYRMGRVGKGIPLKGRALNAEFAAQINEFQPDLVVILDKHSVEEEFFRNIHVRALWLDHHKLQQPQGNVLYINPRRYDEHLNLPTSKLASLISKQDTWIAVSGIVSDWELPDQELWQECEQQHPNYLEQVSSAPEGLYTSDAGRVARMFSFLLKGKNTHVTTALKHLVRLQGPEELLEQKSKEAKLLHTLVSKKQEEYNALLERVQVTEDTLLLFTYDESSTSFTTDLSNELLFTHPEKVILVARESRGSYKCSLRAAHLRIDEILAELLQTVQGTGGGHEHACGAVIPSEDWEHFVELLKAKITQ